MGSIFVFIFLVFVTAAYMRCTKSDFCSSLAPVVILQTFLGIFCGMFFGHISWSIWIALAAAGVYFAVCAARTATAHRSFSGCLAQGLADVVGDRGFLIFTLLFVICAVWNQGKVFTVWDEFSHWGVFLKETLRLDRLYCVSPIDITHKDYVPAVTVFESIWCRMTGRYLESDAYSAIQMLQFAFLLPVVLLTDREGRKICEGTVRWKLVLSDLLKAGTLLVLLAYTSEFFYYFHTIYEDSVVAVVLAYAVYMAACSEDSQRVWKLLLALAFMTLIKTAAVLFFPTVVVYLMVRMRLEKHSFCEALAVCGGMLAVPGLIWGAVQVYIRHYVSNDGNQSLGGLGIQKILSVIFHDGSIPYQNYFEYRYFGNQLIRPVFGFMPAAVVMAVLSACLLYFWIKEKEQEKKRHIFWLGLWMVLTYVYYVLAQWMMYLLAFSEYEAANLYSFQRYMLMFLFAPVILVYREALLHVKVSRGWWVFGLCVVLLYTGFAHRTYMKEFIPGIFSADGQINEPCRQYAEIIKEKVPEGAEESVLMVICGDDGRTKVMVNYYACPRSIDYVSPGEKRYENDFYSVNYSPDKFASFVEQYNWLYLVKTDEQFEEKYSDIFEWTAAREGDIYRVAGKTDDGRVILTE